MYGIHRISKAEFDKLLEEGYQIDEMATVYSHPEQIEELRQHSGMIRHVGGKAKTVQVGKRIYRIFK